MYAFGIGQKINAVNFQLEYDSLPVLATALGDLLGTLEGLGFFAELEGDYHVQ